MENCACLLLKLSKTRIRQIRPSLYRGEEMKVSFNYIEDVTSTLLNALGEHYRKGRAFTKQEFIEYRLKNGTSNDATILSNYNAT